MKLIKKYIFILGLISLSVGGLLVAFSHNGFAQRFFAYSFWIFLIGSTLYISDLKGKDEKK